MIDLEENEVWEKIEEFPMYEVSNMGRIKSYVFNKSGTIVYAKIRGQNKSRKIGYCGYWFYEFRTFGDKNRVMKKIDIHRLVAKYFVDNPNEEEYNIVDHINGNTLDCRSENLRWTNIIENNKNTVKFRGNENEGYDFAKVFERISVTKKTFEQFCLVKNVNPNDFRVMLDIEKVGYLFVKESYYFYNKNTSDKGVLFEDIDCLRDEFLRLKLLCKTSTGTFKSICNRYGLNKEDYKRTEVYRNKNLIRYIYEKNINCGREICLRYIKSRISRI